MTPCDLFSLVRGRTLWLLGDSMMQVFSSGSCAWEGTQPAFTEKQACVAYNQLLSCMLQIF